MTLKNYMDWMRYKLKDNTIHSSILKEAINFARRDVAAKTRCLQCRSTCDSVKDEPRYRIPHSKRDNTYVDCVEVLDVTYDGGYPLTKKTPYYMRWTMQGGSSGTPRMYSYFGGKAQLTGYIVLYPFTSETGKIIEIHAIQFPQPLISSSDVCELNDIFQNIAKRKALADFYGEWDSRGKALLNSVERDIIEYTKYKVI